MAISASMKTPNMADFLAEIENLPKKVVDRLKIGAVASGARIVRDQAIANAPEWHGDVSKGHPPPGTLKRAIYMARLIHKCTPTFEVWAVDVRTGSRTIARGKNKGMSTNDKDAYYAAWVEYGHWTRTPGSTKRQHREAVRTGMAATMGARFIPAQPYMRPAVEAKKEAAFNAMAEYIAKNLPAAVQAMRYVKVVG